MATRTWLGNAINFFDVWTVTFADTWATADTVTMTIGGNSLVVTVGAADTATTDLAQALADAINAAAALDGTGTTDATSNIGGQQINEFTEIVAVAAGSVVTITARTAGKPVTIAIAADTDGDGTATEANASPATGRHFFNNADNWSGAAVPVDGDDLVFDRGNVDLLYALSQGGITPASVTFTSGYSGNVGLPPTNVDTSGKPYAEYRPRNLTLCDSADAQTTVVNIGQGEGPGSRRLNLDFNTGQVSGNVYRTGQPLDSATPPLQISGSHASNVWQILRGVVGFAFLQGSVATVATLRIGYITNRASDAQVRCGVGTTIGTIEKDGGILEVNSAIGTALNQSEGETSINGTGAVAALTVRGGAIRYNTTGTLGGNPIVAGTGLLDFTRDMRSKTVTNPIEVHGDKAAVIDTYKVTGGVVIDMNQTGNLANLRLGDNVRITRGTPS
jgi:hypothetical protein